MFWLHFGIMEQVPFITKLAFQEENNLAYDTLFINAFLRQNDSYGN